MLHIRAASQPAVPPVSMPTVCAATARPLNMIPTNGAFAATSSPSAIGSITFATLLSLTASDSDSYISSLMFCTAFIPRACHTACASAAESAAFWRRILAFESCAVFHVIVSMPITTNMTSAITTPTLPRSEASLDANSLPATRHARRATGPPSSITSISTPLPNIPGGPCRSARRSRSPG